jgi:hypothetical protein
MVRKLLELPMFLVFNSGTNSFGNSSVFAFYLLLFTLVNTIVTLSHCVYLMQSLHHNLLDVCKYLTMQSSIWQMVHTRTFEYSILNIPMGSNGCGRGQVPRGDAPPPPPQPPVSLEQLLATQNDLMRRLVENDERRGA